MFLLDSIYILFLQIFILLHLTIKVINATKEKNDRHQKGYI